MMYYWLFLQGCGTRDSLLACRKSHVERSFRGSIKVRGETYCGHKANISCAYCAVRLFCLMVCCRNTKLNWAWSRTGSSQTSDLFFTSAFQKFPRVLLVKSLNWWCQGWPLALWISGVICDHWNRTIFVLFRLKIKCKEYIRNNYFSSWYCRWPWIFFFFERSACLKYVGISTMGMSRL